MLTDEKDRVVPDTLVEVRRGGTGTPIYFPPGALGDMLVTPTIRDALPENVPVYAFRQPLDAPLDASMEAMAARFCADLETLQPAGAVSLVGYSFAGLLAFEMARQLKSRGRKIKLLVIFDTGPDLSAGGGARGAATRAWLVLKNLPVWIHEDLIRSLDRDTVGRLRRSLQKHVRARFRYRSAVPGFVPKVEHLFDVSHWSPGLYALVENNLKILGAFEYRPYDGDIVLFRARARPLLHPQTWDLGWQPLARSVRVIPSPGNHHTLMHDPHVHYVARGLGAIVRASESGV
jgi:thioesterase domain-containing protein